MPQLSEVTLEGFNNTAVTFTPQNINGGVATLTKSASDGSPIGESILSASLRKTDAQRRKVTIKVAVPTVGQSNANGLTNDVVRRTAYAELTFNFAPDSTAVERDHLRLLVASALTNGTLVYPMVVHLQNVY